MKENHVVELRDVCLMFVSTVSLIRLINGSWVSGSSCLFVSCLDSIRFFFLEHEIMDSIQYVWLVVL